MLGISREGSFEKQTCHLLTAGDAGESHCAGVCCSNCESDLNGGDYFFCCAPTCSPPVGPLCACLSSRTQEVISASRHWVAAWLLFYAGKQQRARHVIVIKQANALLYMYCTRVYMKRGVKLLDLSTICVGTQALKGRSFAATTRRSAATTACTTATGTGSAATPGSHCATRAINSRTTAARQARS